MIIIIVLKQIYLKICEYASLKKLNKRYFIKVLLH